MIGPALRKFLGRYERQVAEAYRAAFVDLDQVASNVADWAPAPNRILEVGCGEGALTERLARAYPGREILAIDISPSLGRLYLGDREFVRFERCAVEQIAARKPGSFDLVVMCDVWHHVPIRLRPALLHSIAICLGPSGVFVLKDWARSWTPIHWMCWASDVVLTGDRVAYSTVGELVSLGTEAPLAGSAEARFVGPWRNNVMIRLVRGCSLSRNPS